jgi:hypothetical protein
MEEHITQLATDLGEVAIDAVLDKGILKDVPLLGSVVNIAKAAASVRDRLLLRKIQAFLSPCSILTDVERAGFHERMQAEAEFKSRVEQILVLHLDRCDDFKKAEIMGAVFIGLVRGHIDLDTFYRLAYCIDRSFAGDILQLDRFPFRGQGQKGYYSPYGPVALSDLVIKMGLTDYYITNLGKTLLKLINDANVA